MMASFLIASTITCLAFFTVESCFILRRNDVSKTLCKRVDGIMNRLCRYQNALQYQFKVTTGNSEYSFYKSTNCDHDIL